MGALIGGIPYILSLHYEDRSKKSKRSPAPAFHAFAKKVRKAMEDAYRAFYNAFHAYAKPLRALYGVLFRC